MQDVEAAAGTLPRECLSKIRVIRTFPGGSAQINQESWIQQITYSGTPAQAPKVTFTVSPL
jgi:hypothetical protein